MGFALLAGSARAEETLGPVGTRSFAMSAVSYAGSAAPSAPTTQVVTSPAATEPRSAASPTPPGATHVEAAAVVPAPSTPLSDSSTSRRGVRVAGWVVLLAHPGDRIGARAPGSGMREANDRRRGPSDDVSLGVHDDWYRHRRRGGRRRHRDRHLDGDDERQKRDQNRTGRTPGSCDRVRIFGALRRALGCAGERTVLSGRIRPARRSRSPTHRHVEVEPREVVLARRSCSVSRTAGNCGEVVDGPGLRGRGNLP